MTFKTIVKKSRRIETYSSRIIFYVHISSTLSFKFRFRSKRPSVSDTAIRRAVPDETGFRERFRFWSPSMIYAGQSLSPVRASVIFAVRGVNNVRQSYRSERAPDYKSSTNSNWIENVVRNESTRRPLSIAVGICRNFDDVYVGNTFDVYTYV